MSRTVYIITTRYNDCEQHEPSLLAVYDHRPEFGDIADFLEGTKSSNTSQDVYAAAKEINDFLKNETMVDQYEGNRYDLQKVDFDEKGAKKV